MSPKLRLSILHFYFVFLLIPFSIVERSAGTLDSTRLLLPDIIKNVRQLSNITNFTIVASILKPRLHSQTYSQYLVEAVM